MTSVSIAQVRRRLEQWRRDFSEDRRPAPPDLRRLVVAAKRQHGWTAVRRELGISSNTLWTWERGSREPAGAKKAARPGEARTRGVARSASTPVLRAPSEFVEVASGALSRSSGLGSGGVSVEWERGDGSRMKASGVSMAEVAGLVERFLSATRGDRRGS